MSADKKLGRTSQDTARYGRVIATGIPPNVLHQYLGPIYDKTLGLRIKETNFLSVNISINSTQGTESGKTLGNFQRTDVASMPDFITRLKIRQVFFIPIAVSVRDKSDSGHKSSYMVNIRMCSQRVSRFIRPRGLRADRNRNRHIGLLQSSPHPSTGGEVDTSFLSQSMPWSETRTGLKQRSATDIY